LIRRLSPKDAEDMAALHFRSIAPAWPESDFANHCGKDICLGIGQPLTAFIIASFAADQAEILTLVTDPKLRRSGFARQLLAASETEFRARGGDIVFLEVAEDNIAAIALYKSCSFKPLGRRPAYYRRENGRVAALTFRKKLDA